MLAACHLKNYCFVITYLLEDEQELSLGMLIRLKRIYNFLLLHACFLNVFPMFSRTNLLTKCLEPVSVFCYIFAPNVGIYRWPSYKLQVRFAGGTRLWGGGESNDLQWRRNYSTLRSLMAPGMIVICSGGEPTDLQRRRD